MDYYDHDFVVFRVQLLRHMIKLKQCYCKYFYIEPRSNQDSICAIQNWQKHERGQYGNDKGNLSDLLHDYSPVKMFTIHHTPGKK